MFKILYLEDDKNLSDTIQEYLEDNNFEVDVAYTSTYALELSYDNNYDLFLFDVNLPDISGFELLKQLRDANITTPAIFTTTLNSIEDLDEGYQAGADDYVKKPFELKELLLRINAIIKRYYTSTNDKITLHDNFAFDLKQNILYDNNEIVKLNQKELQLLKLLIQNRNNIVLLETIYSNVWNVSQTNSEASLRTYIKNLRKILGKEKILSYKKQGYKLVV
jgi:DNA-binding response OmpR family regulator